MLGLHLFSLTEPSSSSPLYQTKLLSPSFLSCPLEPLSLLPFRLLGCWPQSVPSWVLSLPGLSIWAPSPVSILLQALAPLAPSSALLRLWALFPPNLVLRWTLCPLDSGPPSLALLWTLGLLRYLAVNRPKLISACGNRS